MNSASSEDLYPFPLVARSTRVTLSCIEASARCFCRVNWVVTIGDLNIFVKDLRQFGNRVQGLCC